MSKLIYIANFADGTKYVGFCDSDCKRLRPSFEGRVGFAGRLKTKFAEQARCWNYTAPVYVKANAGVEFMVEKFGEVYGEKQARRTKHDLAKQLRRLGADVING